MTIIPKHIQRKHYSYLFITSAFGLGLFPYFPGTCGAIIGLLIHALIVGYLPAPIQFLAIFVVFCLVCAGTVLLTPWAEQFWNTSDPKHFVLDEVAGYLLIPLLFRPVHSLKMMLIGFILFRIFDIFKLIPPAKYIDTHIHGGWGVLLDDLVSAAYVAVVLYGVWWIRPNWLIE